jgi:hypothetical protein
MLPQPWAVHKREVRAHETLGVVLSMTRSPVLLILALAASAGASGAPGRPPQDLRQALQQYQPAKPPAPRQLSPGERAELRRQLADQGQDSRRR